jgi:hypothetical protein
MERRRMRHPHKVPLSYFINPQMKLSLPKLRKSRRTYNPVIIVVMATGVQEHTAENNSATGVVMETSYSSTYLIEPTNNGCHGNYGTEDHTTQNNSVTVVVIATGYSSTYLTEQPSNNGCHGNYRTEEHTAQNSVTMVVMATGVQKHIPHRTTQ